MTKAWYAMIAVVVLGGAVLVFAPSNAPNGEISSTMPVPDGGNKSPEMGVEVPPGITVELVAVHTVRITVDGFVPAALTVKKGDSVTWTNESGRDVWPASAMHPTHAVYPGSSISKCGTADEPTIFDACRGIPSGGSWSFVFNEMGTWRYHDHLRASVTGSVTVE